MRENCNYVESHLKSMNIYEESFAFELEKV